MFAYMLRVRMRAAEPKLQNCDMITPAKVERVRAEHHPSRSSWWHMSTIWSMLDGHDRKSWTRRSMSVPRASMHVSSVLMPMHFLDWMIQPSF
eukprot:249292-Rhodomonas_salina.1